MQKVCSCRYCNEIHYVEVDAGKYAEWTRGLLLAQNAFPDLTAAERELLISGTCPSCWNELFGSPEDEDDGEEKATIEIVSDSWVVIELDHQRNEIVNAKSFTGENGKSKAVACAKLRLQELNLSAMDFLIDTLGRVCNADNSFSISVLRISESENQIAAVTV